jgi:hypothetical protein
MYRKTIGLGIALLLSFLVLEGCKQKIVVLLDPAAPPTGVVAGPPLKEGQSVEWHTRIHHYYWLRFPQPGVCTNSPRDTDFLFYPGHPVECKVGAIGQQPMTYQIFDAGPMVQNDIKQPPPSQVPAGIGPVNCNGCIFNPDPGSDDGDQGGSSTQ